MVACHTWVQGICRFDPISSIACSSPGVLVRNETFARGKKLCLVSSTRWFRLVSFRSIPLSRSVASSKTKRDKAVYRFLSFRTSCLVPLSRFVPFGGQNEMGSKRNETALSRFLSSVSFSFYSITPFRYHRDASRFVPFQHYTPASPSQCQSSSTAQWSVPQNKKLSFTAFSKQDFLHYSELSVQTK